MNTALLVLLLIVLWAIVSFGVGVLVGRALRRGSVPDDWELPITAEELEALRRSHIAIVPDDDGQQPEEAS